MNPTLCIDVRPVEVDVEGNRRDIGGSPALYPVEDGAEITTSVENADGKYILRIKCEKV